MIKLSHHAEDQMKDRGIALAWVEATWAAPERSEQDPIPGRMRLFRSIPELGGRVLRGVVERKDSHVEVVPVLFDRTATKRQRRR